MDWCVRDDQQLAAGEGDPEDCGAGEAEAGERACRYRSGVADAPGQAGAKGHHNNPARQSPGHARKQVQEEVDDQAPERQADDQSLG